MKNKILGLLILFLAGAFSFGLIANVLAQTAEDNLQYPITELGGCENKEACKVFCDKKENQEVCLAFAEKNNLMNQEELAKAKKFLAIENGPGGCTTKETCDTYCEDINHIEECVAFAEQNGFLPQDKLEEAKKISAALKSGVKPPACKNKKECDVYCKDPAHMEECINFAMATGMMQGEELQKAQGMLAAIKKGIKPPACSGDEECQKYCSSAEHMEECINFSIEAGFMSEEEKQKSGQMLQALKKGVKPPACSGQEECDAYCQSDEHFEECLNFSIAAGMVSEKDAEMMRKTSGKGPGGCKSQEECEAFCNNPVNQETCFNFSKENGLISEEEIKKMEEGKQQMTNMFGNMPSEVQSCIISKVGSDLVEKIKSGQAMPSQEMGNQIQQCFNEVMGPLNQNQMMPPCQGENCQMNQNQIMNQQMQPGQSMTGPGGCTSPEECQKYCETHQEECMKLSGGNMQTQNQMMQSCQGDNCQQQNMQMPVQCIGDNCPMMNTGSGMGMPCMGDGCQTMQQNMMTPMQQICEGENCQMMPKCMGDNCQGGQMPMYPNLDQQQMQSGMPMQPGQYIQGGSGMMGPCQGPDCGSMSNQPMMQQQNQYQSQQMNGLMPCEGGNCQMMQQQYMEGQQVMPQGEMPPNNSQMMPMPEGNLQPQETTPPPPTSFLQKIFGSLVDNTKSLFELFIEIF